jgi:hypothetical protein
MIPQSDVSQKTRAELVEECRLKFANPYIAALETLLDNVIEPEENCRIKRELVDHGTIIP